MGIRVPRGECDRLLFRIRAFEAGGARVVRQELRGPPAARGAKATQSLGPLRHVREFVGVVQRFLQGGLLQRISAERSPRTGSGANEGSARRGVAIQRGALPLGVSL